jgi:hypothetical protein
MEQLYHQQEHSNQEENPSNLRGYARHPSQDESASNQSNNEEYQRLIKHRQLLSSLLAHKLGSAPLKSFAPRPGGGLRGAQPCSLAWRLSPTTPVTPDGGKICASLLSRGGCSVACRILQEWPVLY